MELLTKRFRTARLNVDFNRFVQEQIARSWWLSLLLLALAGITFLYAARRVVSAPVSTILVLGVWVVSIALVGLNEARHQHNSYTLWLKDNLYNSLTNALVTLLIVLALVAAFFSLLNYVVLNASFSAVPPTQLRADLVSAESSQVCFTLGGILPDESRTAIVVEREQRCFPTAQLIDPLAEGVVLGQTAADVCFNTIPDDPENGRYCFESTAASPEFFEVQRQFSGANWGAVRANLPTLMIFRFERSEVWRLWASLIILALLAGPSLYLFREKHKNSPWRRALTILWVTTPLLFYILLRGVPDDIAFESIGLVYIVLAAGAYVANRYAGPWLTERQRTIAAEQGASPAGLASDLLLTLLRFALAAGVVVFGVLGALAAINLLYFGLGGIGSGGEKLLPFLDPDRNWGGFLLTIIIAVFAIIVSFPIGLVLALGRRSKIGGIPTWLTYGIALVIAVWGLTTSTPGNLEAARNTFERVLAYWPIGVLILAYLFQRTWKGNVLAAFTTLYIEFIRGIPLIAVLFISITLFPLILPDGVEILSVWRVMWGFTLFAAAYLAENVRGGLQSIPNGQYEAADALGLNTVQKYRLIILPQALRVVIPAIVGQFIGLFKDTTLVAFLGLLDFLGIANSLSANPAWLNIRREVYLFLAIVYFIGSALMAGYSRRLERRLGLGTR